MKTKVYRVHDSGVKALTASGAVYMSGICGLKDKLAQKWQDIVREQTSREEDPALLECLGDSGIIRASRAV